MNKIHPLAGLHHVTALASDPQQNVDFYAGFLGLRLVKRTVNFDDPSTYHLYYGDEVGSPGSILTFFPWPHARRGLPGVGQASAVGLAVPERALGFWVDRLRAAGVASEGEPRERFGSEAVIVFRDPDGLPLELVATRESGAFGTPWRGAGLAEEHAIRGLHGVTLSVAELAPTREILVEDLGARELAAESGDRHRFQLGGSHLDVVVDPKGRAGRISAGSIHHVAFRIVDEAQEIAWQHRLAERGRFVTPVQDRQYFRSIYFREPGGVLFEIATDPPGFGFDESPENLGAELRLPPWLEANRARIVASLPPLVGPKAAGAVE